MITYDMIIEAQNFLVEQWEDAGKAVILAAYHANPFNEGMEKFLSNCEMCGGNWGGMLLSGIRKLWPEVYEAIPNDMGIFSWPCICYTLLLCGVDTSAEE